ncbi:T9SS type B sorting domain-containing protein [Formosa sp. S-31]|uniref:T9SS type B sorting domain-containing protein n=1 Tax=Formosa sp. S-31 TaxID=2790949 RepID=UPI003EB8B2CC
MKLLRPGFNLYLSLLFCVASLSTYAQLGLCSGNSGNPIFTEDFGAGTSSIQLQSPSETTYTYVASEPNDGYYTISSNTNWYGWHITQDHTAGDTNGRSLIVNADYTAGEFFRTTISGLCENTTYEFSAWLLNLLPASACDNNGIPVNVKFEIWDDSNSVLLASGDTGDIAGTTSPEWNQYGLVFTSASGQNSIILKMINNGAGGCGNDVAIDDIVFKSCGDVITIEDVGAITSYVVCEEDVPFNPGKLSAVPTTGISSTHFYQWQKSNDGNNWIDISGATSGEFIPDPINQTTYFRAKVAEDQVNVNQASCNSFTDEFTVEVIPTPDAPASEGDIVDCDEVSSSISVVVSEGESVNWYDAATGGHLIQSNNTSYYPTGSGTFYAEAYNVEGGCVSDNRTAVSYSVSEAPDVRDETVLMCDSEEVELSVSLADATYLWNSGETSSSITVNSPGTYVVTVTNAALCSKDKVFTVEVSPKPVIKSVMSGGNTIYITTTQTGNFEYALGDSNYQISPIFKNVEGGYYNIQVRDRNGCGEDELLDYLHLVIPSFFTPNGDGDHDYFELAGIENYEASEVSIFNRFGVLMKFSKNTPFSWDGTFENRQMPASDYWYIISINSHTYTGHFTLKR